MELVSFVLVLTLTVLVLAVVQDYFADKNIWYYLLSVSTIFIIYDFIDGWNTDIV